jgi:hypothetical protein
VRDIVLEGVTEGVALDVGVGVVVGELVAVGLAVTEGVTVRVRERDLEAAKYAHCKQRVSMMIPVLIGPYVPITRVEVPLKASKVKEKGSKES